MTTAAEALVRDCANRLDQLFRQDYTMREVEAELRRLLRATQSNGRSSGSCSNGNAGDGPGQPVAGESPAPEPVAWMMPLGERGLIEWGHKRPDTGDLDKWRPLYSHSHECSDDFTGEIATPSKESLLEDLRLLSNLERAHKMESNSLFIENGQLRKSLKDVLRMLEAAHRQSGIHGTDNKRIVAARSVLNAPPSLYAAPPQAQQAQPVGLTFDAFRDANVKRCVKWHPAGIASWSPSDWLTAVTGELGELASLLKMRNRERDGLPGNKFSPTDKQIADEIADVFTYLDLLAEVLGIDLGRAAVEKFNEVSERVGFPDRL